MQPDGWAELRQSKAMNSPLLAKFRISSQSGGAQNNVRSSCQLTMDPDTAGGLGLGAAQLVLQMFATCVKGKSLLDPLGSDKS